MLNGKIPINGKGVKDLKGKSHPLRVLKGYRVKVFEDVEKAQLCEIFPSLEVYVK